MKYTFAIAALFAVTNATKLTQLTINKHSCDFVNEDGSEVITSLMPEYVQLDSNDEDDTVAGAKEKFAAMQAQMDAAVAHADANRDAQQVSFEKNIKEDNP